MINPLLRVSSISISFTYTITNRQKKVKLFATLSFLSHPHYNKIITSKLQRFSWRSQLPTPSKERIFCVSSVIHYTLCVSFFWIYVTQKRTRYVVNEYDTICGKWVHGVFCGEKIISLPRAAWQLGVRMVCYLQRQFGMGIANGIVWYDFCRRFCVWYVRYVIKNFSLMWWDLHHTPIYFPFNKSRTASSVFLNICLLYYTQFHSNTPFLAPFQHQMASSNHFFRIVSCI